jgi:hypothetical protein
MTAGEHWTSVEHNYRTARQALILDESPAAGAWQRVTRAVCSGCDWTSPWYFAGPVAVEAGLEHSADASSVRAAMVPDHDNEPATGSRPDDRI